MQKAVHCPLCKIPVTIQKGMGANLKSTRYATRKSQVFCPQCGKTLKEALLVSLQKKHQHIEKNS